MFNLFKHKNHNWQLAYCVGEFHKYHCKNTKCGEIRYTLETRKTLEQINDEHGNLLRFDWVEATCRELSIEEAQPHIQYAKESIEATMWILDNVEPTFSAGREDNIDYPYKTEDGKIVKK